MASWNGNRRRSAQNERETREREGRETAPRDIADPPGMVLTGENMLAQARQEYGQCIEAFTSDKSLREIDREVAFRFGALQALADFARVNGFKYIAAKVSVYIDSLYDAERSWWVEAARQDADSIGADLSVDADTSTAVGHHLPQSTSQVSSVDSDTSIDLGPHLRQSTSRLDSQLPPGNPRPYFITYPAQRSIRAQPLQAIPPQSSTSEAPNRAPSRRRRAPIRSAPRQTQDPGVSEASNGVQTDPLYDLLHLHLVVFLQASFAAQSNHGVREPVISRLRTLETQIRRHTELEQVLSLVNHLRSVIDRLNSVPFSTLMAEINPLNVGLAHNSSGGLGQTYCKDCTREPSYNRPQEFVRHFICQHFQLRLITCLTCRLKFCRKDSGIKHALQHAHQLSAARARPAGILGPDQITQLENNMVMVVGQVSDVVDTVEDADAGVVDTVEDADADVIEDLNDDDDADDDEDIDNDDVGEGIDDDDDEYVHADLGHFDELIATLYDP